MHFLPLIAQAANMLRGGARSMFCPTFSKVGKSSRQGTSNRRLCRRESHAAAERPRSGKDLISLCELPPVCAESRFAKPRNFPERERFYVLFASTKRTGSSRRAAALSTPGERFKTLQNNFFVIFPPFVPKPVCDATHFFGCFEPVRKGYCTSDARLMFSENGKLYCKLTGACRIRKG